MSTHNICFRREIRKILCGYPLLSVAMHQNCLSDAILMITDNICFCGEINLYLVLVHVLSGELYKYQYIRQISTVLFF